MSELRLAPPTRGDERAFLEAVAGSRELHADWVQPPSDGAGYLAYIERGEADDHDFSLVWRGDDLVGTVNVNEIIRGRLQGATIGFYAFAPLAGRGLMTEAVRLAVRRAFDDLRLHRLEANVQPHNSRSLALVQRTGFRREGFSPGYLFIAGQWRDHERWAVVSGDAPPPGISF